MWLQAVHYAEKAVQIAPEWSEGYLTLSRAQREFGEPEIALETIQKGITLGLSALDGSVNQEVDELLLICSTLEQRREEIKHSIAKCVEQKSHPEAEICMLHLLPRAKVQTQSSPDL